MTPARGHRASVVVGIATRNRAEFLRKAIDRVFRQSQRPLRVAVVDDGSSDETPLLQREFASVSWERWESAQGYVRARNRMMLTADEDYYVSLDDDSWFVAGDEIAIAVDYLAQHPSVAAVAFDIISPDRRGEAPRGAKTPVAMFIGCGHVLRLSAVRELGGYAEFPGTYGVEEKDFCLRLIDAGYRIVKLDGVHVWHDKTSSARDAFEQHRSGVCNDLTLALRRIPAALVVAILAVKVARHLAFAIRNRLLGACLCGLGDFIRGAREAWRLRRPVRLSSFAQFCSLARAGRRPIAVGRSA
jgi:GT2 family glycosyltransferase